MTKPIAFAPHLPALPHDEPVVVPLLPAREGERAARRCAD